MIPRSDYMAHKVTHDEYYGQFVTEPVVKLVKQFIGEERVLQSKDPHFNDIPLQQWDKLAETFRLSFPATMRAIAATTGWNGTTLAERGCVLKRAAKRIRDGV